MLPGAQTHGPQLEPARTRGTRFHVKLEITRCFARDRVPPSLRGRKRIARQNERARARLSGDRRRSGAGRVGDRPGEGRGAFGDDARRRRRPVEAFADDAPSAGAATAVTGALSDGPDEQAPSARADERERPLNLDDGIRR